MQTMVDTNILIVTKERGIGQELHGHLKELGYNVVGIASTNEEVITRVEDLKPDLILTDIRLNGGREGIKTGELIHSHYNIPIIYITGTVGQTTIQLAKSTGPFGYVFKPFDKKQICATIETALLRHRMEAELREGRQWFNAVLDGISDGVIALDAQGAIRFINPIATQLTGWSETEAMGKSLMDVFPLMDQLSHERFDIIGIKAPLLLNNAKTRFEGSLPSLNGRTTPVEADITSITDGTGSTAGFVLVFRDITKQREAVEENQRQRQRAEALVETAARLNAQLTLRSVLDTVCKISDQAIQSRATAVFLQDARQDGYNLKAMYTDLPDLNQFNGMRFEIPRSVFDSVLTEKEPVTLISDIQNQPQAPYLNLAREKNIHTVVITGLYQQHDLIGALISIFIGEPITLPEDTLALLKGLADQAVISITNASLFEQVRRGREHQKALSTKLVELQETERRQLARELHDQIGQVLTGLQFMLEFSKNQTGEAQLNQINNAQKTVSELIEQIRELSLNLRPAMLDDIGLQPTLLWHIERYSKQTGIKVSFQNSGIPQRLPPDIETAVYRIIQEALTNIARHARVTEAFIRLALQDDILRIEIVDHGIGIDPGVDISKWTTAGVAGMHERANMLGGDLTINSAPNQGTQILAMLPLDRKPVERRNRARNIVTG